MVTVGPSSPGSAASVNTGAGAAWSNPTNCLSSNNSRTTVALTGTQRSDSLAATNFGFSLPSTASIDGIKVEVEANRPAGNSCKSIAVLTKDGANAVGTEASPHTLTTTDTYYTDGSASDLWGTTWTYSEINASTFGVFIVGQGFFGDVGGSTAQVDHVRITITYSEPFSVSGSMSSTGTVITSAKVNPAGVMASAGAVLTKAKVLVSGSMASVGDVTMTASSGGASFSIGGVTTSVGSVVTSVKSVRSGATASAGAVLCSARVNVSGTTTSVGAIDSGGAAIASLVPSHLGVRYTGGDYGVLFSADDADVRYTGGGQMVRSADSQRLVRYTGGGYTVR